MTVSTMPTMTSNDTSHDSLENGTTLSSILSKSDDKETGTVN